MKYLTLTALLITLLIPATSHALDSTCEKCTFFHSDALGADMGYRIFLPPSYEKDKSRRFPAVYLLHGYNFARNNPDTAAPKEGVNHWMDQEQIPEVAGCLMTVQSTSELDTCLEQNGVPSPNDISRELTSQYPDITLPLPEMIIVTPDGKNSFYMDRLDGKKIWPPLDGPEINGGLCKGATGQFESYITRDLITHIDKTYRTISDRAHRGIGGFSMGGVGSMNLALKHQDLFVSVTSLSATYNLIERVTNPFDYSYAKNTIPEILSVAVSDKKSGPVKPDISFIKKNDPYTIASALDKINLEIYFDAGAKDFFSGKDNFATFAKFDELLKSKGTKSSPAEHVIPSTDGNGNGLHTSRYWRSRTGVILAFHAKAFGKM